MSICEECGTDHYALGEYIAELEAKASTAYAKGRTEGFHLGYSAGWINAAKWADRVDLIADIDSPAFLDEYAAAIEKLLEKKP